MNKNNNLYILDTNIILSDQKAIFAFPKQKIVIPLTVIEELDKMKKRQDEIGKNARVFLRIIDSLYSDEEKEWLELENKSKLKIEVNHTSTLEKNLDVKKMDNRILSVAAYYSNFLEGGRAKYNVILKTNDYALRVKAKVFKIKTENYVGLELEENLEENKGYHVINEGEKIPNMNPNEYLLTYKDERSIIKERFVDNDLVKKKRHKEIWDLTPKNIEQELAIDLLLNPEIPLVCLTGKAGTGKTLISLAAGLDQTIEKNNYSKLVVTRPVIPMGRDLGYLPGSIEEKMDPWMQPFYDNLEYLIAKEDGVQNRGAIKQKVQHIIEQANIEIEPLTYIRGRSLPNQFIIIDEAQNLTLHEVKTILTRVGDKSKIVLCGDPNQIDNAFVDELSNGLSQIIEKLKKDKLTAHIKFSQGERSALAELVANKI